ncbi:MAG: alpha/beta hydrolase [Planctomycetota bacterium]|nr:alpha/beta hydrolase [Planctomycetota bacterium]
MFQSFSKRCFSSLAMLCTFFPAVAQTDEPTVEMKLWPKTPPGIITAEGPERDTSGPKGRMVQGRPVIRLGDVSEPMLTVYSPPAEKNTGAAVVVCPGGGYQILAYDLEGTEVCEWLNSIGVTGVLLKYRVPRPKRPKPAKGQRQAPPLGPLMDAQRALSLVRANAKEWNINPERIGVLGFSAGGNLAARLSTNYTKRTYDAIDDADEVRCRPDFSVLIYPAYFYRPQDELLSPDLPVDEKTPPSFLVMSWDDGVGPENILRMGIALKRNKVPAEVHLYPTGGHGYGLRPSEHEVTTWPARCAAWMKANGWLEK